MTKEDMVHRLVSFSVQAALAESKKYWLSDLFERGFAGYRNLSAEQLRRELELRGLTAPEREDLDEDLDDGEWESGGDWDGADCGLELRYQADQD